uniref:Acetolactate synthase n=1 Tax=Chenopodium quinoa TaxID=63459 RepID=A0A803NEA7_CHEQI
MPSSMAATSSNLLSPLSPTLSSKTPKPQSSIYSLPFPTNPKTPSSFLRRPLQISASQSANPKPPSATQTAVPSPLTDENPQSYVSRFALMNPEKAVMSSNVLPRHEQGGVFAAEGYARATGRVGVCIATSGPGATNLVSGLADALLDSVPLVAITGQVPRRMIGTDAFQETPIVEQQLVVPNWDQPIKLGGYVSRLPKSKFSANEEGLLEQIVRLMSEAKKPVLYVGGGCLNSSEELRKFVELTGIPVASTLMGLGAYPCFDRVTGKLEAFASRAKIVHIDIDSAEIGKNKQPHVSICADVKLALKGMNKILESRKGKLNLDYSSWREELGEQKKKFPLSFKTFGEAIPPQYAIQMLDELTDGDAVISTGVGQHQMWAAQHYKYRNPRQWLTSGGLEPWGLGYQLPLEQLWLDQSMVVQWEDRFYKANRAHYIPWKPCKEAEIFPDMLKFAEACDIPAARVTKVSELRAAMQKMLDTPGPYLLDVIVPSSRACAAYDPKWCRLQRYH